ncbi:glycosyltransferase, partial [Lactobacillus sp. XV13L]|nr:glycosyltransferase [Lactobacillus sp. XV13L]
IMEAQAHGVPVISYDINYGPADLLAAGSSGFLVTSGNVDELAAKVEQFFGDQALRENMSAAAYKNAERFSGENIWRAWQKYVINAD